ncbi:MAG: YdcH family protein [Bdellovibrionales bacterium]
MPLTARIESLKKRHAEIEQQLHNEETSPAQDETKVSKLKREKLSLKDEIAKLEEEQEKAA